MSLASAFVCVTLFAVQTVLGQITTPVPSEAQIATLLRSEKAVDIAWGAFWSAHFRHAAAIPDLLRGLETPPSGREVDRELVALEVLDAFVQLDASVPAEAVRPYYDRWPVQALALWEQPTPGRDEILVGLLRDARNERWFGLANLLLQTGPIGFARAIVESPLSLHVTVTDPGVGGGIAGGLCCGMAGDLPEPTSPYPPVPEYRFSSLAPGRIVLSTGPRPVFYERDVTSRWTSRIRTEVDGPKPAERVAYLAELAKTKFAASPVISVAWTNPAGLERRVRRAQIALRTEYERVFALLVTRGLLEAQEARRLTANIEVHLSDERTSRRSPLPEIGPLRR